MADPPPPPAPSMVLVDRYVQYEDELLAVVEESGQPSLDQRIESLLASLPDSSTSEEERDAAIHAEITRYTEEVFQPAYALLRERRASRPSPNAVRKVPPAACANADDVAYYGELLDGIEPCLPSPLAGAPSVTSLTLRFSWPPKHPVRSYSISACISGSDGAFLVLYFGSHRPCSPEPGFYLVYDTLANSVALVPPLSPSGSHCGLADELAIVVIHKEPHHPCPCFYVLVELLFTVKSHSCLPSNKGTLFMWWSPGSGPLATGRWIQREVVLPIPADDDDGDGNEGATSTTTPTYSFHADMVIPVSGRCICWVDLLKGILVCDNIDRLAAGDSDSDALAFYFIPLPDGCAIQPDFRKGRGQPEEYRSMCSITSELIRFVSMEAYSEEGYPMDTVVFRTWDLSLPRWGTGSAWRWEMGLESRVDVWNDPIYKNDLKLQPLTPRFPTISTTEDDVVYLLLTDFRLEQGWTVGTGSYVFGLDIRHGKIASAIGLPCDENGIVFPPRIFASRFSSFLTEEMISWRRSLDLTDPSIMGQEIVAHEGESRGKFGKWTLCEEDEDTLLTYTLGAHRTGACKLTKWTLREEDEPSVPYTLGAHFATLKFCQDGLGGRRIISTLGASPGRAKFEPSASVGLHCALS